MRQLNHMHAHMHTYIFLPQIAAETPIRSVSRPICRERYVSSTMNARGDK